MAIGVLIWDGYNDYLPCRRQWLIKLGNHLIQIGNACLQRFAIGATKVQVSNKGMIKDWCCG